MKNLFSLKNVVAVGELKSDTFASGCDEIYISIKAECDKECRIEIVSIDGGGKENLVYTESVASGEISFEYSFDPISLAVYRGAEAFFVRISANGEIIAPELEVYEKNAELSGEDESSLCNTGMGISGERIAYVYDKNGECKEIPRVPRRVLFVGNSLVFGMGKRYGMCASHPDKDYFHYVSEHIKKYSPVCRFDKLYGSMFEHAESLDAFEYWYNTDCALSADEPIAAKSFFTPDVDLVIFQLSDNVNTDEKERTFELTKDIVIERIKEACPNARIIWVHGWYNRNRTLDKVRRACERWKLERIDIGALRSEATEAHKQKYYYDVNAKETRDVSDRWITHPGDLGMRKIADKIIQKLDL